NCYAVSLHDALPIYIGKGAVAVVEEEPDAAVFRHQHVGPAVVVDVADGHSHAKAGDIQPRPDTDVRESPILLLVVKPIAGLRIRSEEHTSELQSRGH